MTLFWLYAALLIGVALAFLVTPLVRARAKAVAPEAEANSRLAVYRDQFAELDADLAAGRIDREQWESAREDVERGLLEAGEAPPAAAAPAPQRSKALAIGVAAAVPLLAIGLYLVIGNPQGLNPAGAEMQGSPHQLSKEQIEAMVARLANRLESNPEDGEGWIMLARTYSALGHFPEAANAFAKASAKFPQDPQLLADYADALAMAQGQSLEGKPEELAKRALEIDGNNMKALALTGTAAFERKDFAKAIEYWERMVPLVPPDSDTAKSVQSSIEEARSKLGGSTKSVVALAQDKSPAAAKGKSLTGTVNLGAKFTSRAAPEDTVFVLARPAQGSRMPLAALRVKVKDLPLNFSFDDSMAMNPSAKLSDFADVVVAARVSKSGNVMPQRGDFEGESKPVHPGASGIKVEIAKEVE